MQRARRIERFLSRNMMAAEQFTGQPGSTVPLKETIEAFDKLAKGGFDHLPGQAFFLIGGLEDLQKKAESLGAKMDDSASDGAPALTTRRRTTAPPGRSQRQERIDWLNPTSRSSQSNAKSRPARPRFSSRVPPRERSAFCPATSIVAQLVDDAMVRSNAMSGRSSDHVDGSFMSVTDDGVIVLAESAELDLNR